MLLAIGGLFSGAVNAAALQFSISTTVSLAGDNYDGPYQVGDTITGTFIVDDETANGGPGSDRGPGTIRVISTRPYGSLTEHPAVGTCWIYKKARALAAAHKQ